MDFKVFAKVFLRSCEGFQIETSEKGMNSYPNQRGLSVRAVQRKIQKTLDRSISPLPSPASRRRAIHDPSTIPPERAHMVRGR